MRKFIIKIAFFLFLMVMANVSFLKIVQKFEWNFSKAKKISELKNQQVDLLILGNSLSFDAIDAKVLEQENIKAYNLALGGANIKANIIQLENYLKTNNNPDKIFIGLSSTIWDDLDGEESIPIIEYFYSKAKVSYRELPMVKFKWLANEVIKRIVSKSHREAYVYNGQFRTNKVIRDNSQYNLKMDSIFNEEKYGNAIYLNRIDSICRSENIKLIIAEMPGNKEKQNAIPIGPLTYTNQQGLQSQIYNFNNYQFATLLDPATDWLTVSHLNINGSKKFTEELIRRGVFD